MVITWSIVKVYIVVSWTTFEVGTTLKASIVLAVSMVTVKLESRKLIKDEGPKVLTSKEFEGRNDGGFLMFPNVIVTDKVLNSDAKHPLILTVLDAGSEILQVPMLKEALTRVGD